MWTNEGILYLDFKYVPLQLNPSPWKPAMHEHTKEPGVFEQLAFTWQLLEEHSSISLKMKQKTGAYYLLQEIFVM